jgi:hypothetical protein
MVGVPVGSDPGLTAVERLYSGLMVDEAWSVRRERGFTWWGFHLAQHVEAGPCFQAGDGATASVVRVWTDVVCDVADAGAAVQACSMINTQAVMAATVFDPDRRVIEEASTAIVYNDTGERWSAVMVTAAVAQNTAAHSRSQALAEAVGGRPWATDHPSSGERLEMDDILNVPERVIVPAGAEPSAFAGDLLERIGSMQLPLWVAGSGDRQGFTAEVIYSSDTSVAAANVLELHDSIEGEDAGGPGTALVQVVIDAPHPEYGSGALVILRLPVGFDEDEAADAINWLNRLEASGDSDFSMCRDPSNPGSPAFVSFVPSVLARPGLLENLVVYDTLRARWAHAVFET